MSDKQVKSKLAIHVVASAVSVTLASAWVMAGIRLT
jgi:hypothetical protein